MLESVMAQLVLPDKEDKVAASVRLSPEVSVSELEFQNEDN